MNDEMAPSNPMHGTIRVNTIPCKELESMDIQIQYKEFHGNNFLKSDPYVL